MENTKTRKSKYCLAIEAVLADMGHATNAELLAALRVEYPSLTATTVHRATARLAARGDIAFAPSDKDGSLRYDSNRSPHDHFHCMSCGLLIDTDIKDQIIPVIESSMADCRISGRLTIGGLCKKCALKNLEN